MLFLMICFVGFLQFAAATPLPIQVKNTDFSLSINKEYKLQYYVKANWYNAYLFCRDNGMQLATINSEAEQDYLLGIIKDLGLTNSWWISGSDVGEEGRFSWYSSGKLLKYKNWLPNQPDNKDLVEHCLEMRDNGKWNDAPCNASLSFICETSATS